MKIGELATTTDTAVETIRFYERQGLLPEPQRSDANYRIYDDSHVQRLQFIRHCRSLDMALDEIRVLLKYKDEPQQNCRIVNELLDEHVGHVAQRIRELRALEKQLLALRGQCRTASAAADCGILKDLDEATRASPAAATRTGHIHGTHGLAQRSSHKLP